MQNFIRGFNIHIPQYKTKGSTKKKWTLEGVEKVTDENKQDIIKKGTVLLIIEEGVTIKTNFFFPAMKPFSFYGLENYPGTLINNVLWYKTGAEGLFGNKTDIVMVKAINLEIKWGRLYYDKTIPPVSAKRFKFFCHMAVYYKDLGKNLIER